MKIILKKNFSVTIITVIVWNCLAFFYHQYFMHMGIETALAIQIIALFMEIIVSPLYEKTLIFINKGINKGVKKQFKTHLHWHKIVPKYVSYTALFIGFYGSLYILRLLTFNKFPIHIDGLNIHIQTSDASFIQSTINMIWFTFLGGWAMGSFILLRKSRKISVRKFLNWILSLRKIIFI